MTTDVYKAYVCLFYSQWSFPLPKILSDKQLKTRHLQITSKAMCFHALKA